MSTAEKAKIRKWILMAAASLKGNNGVTVQHIKKFLDTKKDGLSNKPETKLILNRLLETGHLKKKDGKYVIKRSNKTPGKEMKRSKSSMRNAGRRTVKKSKSIIENVKKSKSLVEHPSKD
ncbi:hypothetical protein HNY73_016807 [Argiope bruennichi]|uniref:H15 domain-containing protein n=1 Tax=Argiope bruennichi TaxID=94029 RepID=A0A8T0EJW0_ARGBR|nr:hypothetical protein HNY73_016807 [Argiope bruennichi]